MLRRRKPGGGGSYFERKATQRSSKAVSPMLLQAHRLFSWGQYLPAADLYDRLAEAALSREPSRAPQLFLQAGRARIFGGQAESGMRQIWRGLELLNSQQRYADIHRVGWRIIYFLENNGLESQTGEVQTWLTDLQHPEGFDNWGEKPITSASKVRLPLSCPSCGGVVDPSEVEWVDDTTVVCVYCGSMLRGEA